MFDAISRSDPAHLPPLQRLRGRVELSAKLVAGRTRLDRLYQEGSAKARLPKTADAALEAILINTGGGMTGGDRLHVGTALWNNLLRIEDRGDDLAFVFNANNSLTLQGHAGAADHADWVTLL